LITTSTSRLLGTVGCERQDEDMRVGVIDVGSNTARLLVADVSHGSTRSFRETRAPIALGDEIERQGFISEAKIDQAARAVAEAVATARSAGADDVAVLVTSPGRQSANGADLVHAISTAAGFRVRLLTAAEEARLAYAGAVAATRPDSPSVAVCDVGGGSAQIAAGLRSGAPTWIRSIDIGSLRLTRRHFSSDPPRRRELAGARAELDMLLASVNPPEVQAALATGGTARSLQKLVGCSLRREELEEALAIVSRHRAKEVERRYGVPRWRARLLPAGVTILAAIQDRLSVELVVSSGGLREGAALELAEHLRAAA
jgi:exopolyphosphatase/guanosine-5'-triphosphate,3'-diphosphate pyrophosphatase